MKNKPLVPRGLIKMLRQKPLPPITTADQLPSKLSSHKILMLELEALSDITKTPKPILPFFMYCITICIPDAGSRNQPLLQWNPMQGTGKYGIRMG
jgi:hypothetical protein